MEACPERSRRIPDGEGKPPRFIRAPAPTRDQLGGLVRSVAVRARRMLSSRLAPDPVEERQQPALWHLPPLAGQALRRRLQPLAVSAFEVREPKLKAAYDGFDLQAATAEAHERVAVERFARVVHPEPRRRGMRGPLALDRLSLGPKETLLYRLKHVLSPAEGTPKPDGTTHLVFTPMQLLERLARLVPLPDKHMVRFHGVLAPSAT